MTKKELEEKVKAFFKDFLKDELVQEHLLTISGVDKPIYDCPPKYSVHTIKVADNHITILWDSTDKIFEDFVQNIVSKYSDLFKFGDFVRHKQFPHAAILLYFQKCYTDCTDE